MPDDYAIVVGIDHYRNDLAPPLRGARNDAQFFSEWLLSDAGGGLRAENVTLILSTDASQNVHPTREHVEDAMLALIQRYLDSGQRVGRRLYLFLSGHGVTPTGPDEDCGLLMANATRLALGRSIPGRRAANTFRLGALFEQVVLFMDCCRTVHGQSPPTFLSFQDLVAPEAGQAVPWLYGFATRWSLKAGERELPSPFGGGTAMQGVFTHALLEGLRQGVDPSGRVTAASLKNYLVQRVPQLLPPDDRQDPDVQYDGEIVLATGKETRVTLTLERPEKGFQVRHGAKITEPLPLAAQEVEPGKVSFSLRPGLYLFAVPGAGDAFESSLVKEVMGEELHVRI